jgi:hypothetical protein
MREEYKSEEWIKLRDQAVAEAYNGKCQMCKENPAQTAHHLTYEYGVICDKKYLIPICWDCHNDLHGYVPISKIDLPLKGLYFHTVEKGVLTYQGIISGCTDESVYCQLFSWIDGRPIDIVIRKISEISWDSTEETGFILYPGKEEQDHSFVYGKAHRYSPF